jgi:hypothetical protein
LGAQVKRVIRFLLWFPLMVICVAIAEEITTGKLHAQGKPPPIIVPGSWTTTDLTQPAMAEYFQPFIYESWWKEIGACEHLIVPIELARAVHFVFVNSPTMVVDMDPGVLGFTYAPALTIYVVLPLIYTETIIKHEMLHWLLYVNGVDQGKDWHIMPRFNSCGVTRFYHQ